MNNQNSGSYLASSHSRQTIFNTASAADLIRNETTFFYCNTYSPRDFSYVYAFLLVI